MALWAFPAPGISQNSPAGPFTNLQLFRTLAGDVATRSFRMVPESDTSGVTVNVVPHELAWVVEDDIIRAANNNGDHVVAANATRSYEFGILELSVRYDDVRRDWLFGPKLVDRTITCAMHARIVDLRSGAALLSQDQWLTQRDTVLLSDVERLESSTIQATKGTLPPEGVFENITEPIIVLGTIAVAVVLLFTVRS